MRHGVPVAAMIAQPHTAKDNNNNLANITMTDCSILTHGEQNVQHGSSTWLEQPTNVMLSNLSCFDPADSFVPVSSMRHFCPVEAARLDPPQLHDAVLASSGSRYAPLQESEQEVVTLDNQGIIAEITSLNDRDEPADDSGARNSKKDFQNKIPKHRGITLKKDEEPKATDVSYPSDQTENHKNFTGIQGWHQAILPQGHAQVSYCKSKLSKSLNKKHLNKAAACGFNDPLLKDEVASCDTASGLLDRVDKKVKSRWFCTAAQTGRTIKLLRTTKHVKPKPTVALRTSKPQRPENPDMLASPEKCENDIGQKSKVDQKNA